MDKDRIDTIAAAAPSGEQIKTNSAEYLRICRGTRPPLLPDKPVVTDRSAADHPDDLQLRLRARLFDGTAWLTTGGRR
jgi:hypothetical protein